MAYSPEQWERTKAYFESGQYSLSQISDKTGIDKSQISRKAKTQQWKQGKNSDYIEAKKTLAVKKTTENTTTLQILDDIADEQIRHKKLINSNAELLASQIPKVVKSFVTKQINEETGEEEEVCMLEARTIKELAEANDRIAITLKVAERHAPKIEVNNTNATQNNYSPQEISQAIADGLPD